MRCADCRFAHNGTPRWSYNECRRFPPSVNSNEHGDTYPNVSDDQWCGEFKPKADPLDEPAIREQEEGEGR